MKYSERIAVCKACPYFTSAGTCGTPFVGNKIVEDGKEYKLCGCFIHLKAPIPFLSCPMGKWEKDNTPIPMLPYETQLEYYTFLKGLKESKVVAPMDNARLTAIWNKLYPHNKVRPSSCPPCVMTTITGLIDKLRPGLHPDDL